MAKPVKTQKEEDKSSSSIQIKRNRGTGGKKRPDLFARLRTEHPLDGILPVDDMPSSTSSLETKKLADSEKTVNSISPSLLADLGNIASTDDSSLLAGDLKSANLLAVEGQKPPSLLAGTSEKTMVPASKLADLTKSASRSDLQQLADLRQSKGARVQYATRIRASIKKAFDMFCAEEGIFQQDFIELAGISYIEHYRELLADLNAKSASNLAHDDLKLITLWKTKPAIINLYLRYNSIFNEKTKWSARDDDAGVALNEYDLRVIELGILQTHSNRGYGGGGKINSFSYYLPEIRNFVELKMSAEALNTMLKINRQRWKQSTGREVDLSFLEEQKDK